MTNQERQYLKEILVATALYYGQEVADPALQLFVEDLEDLPIKDVLCALKELRRDPKITRLPLPAVIRAKLQPPQTDDDESREAAARIIAAIAKFGWPNSGHARAYIGELGWAVVQRQGGWTTVCDMVDEGSLTSYQAQWRDLAGAIRRRALAGQLDSPPSIPEPSNNVRQITGPVPLDPQNLLASIRKDSA